MITKTYESPEMDIFYFAAEAGFVDSKEIDGGTTEGFGTGDSGNENDWY